MPVIQVQHHPLLLVRWGWCPGALMLLAALATVAVATTDTAPSWSFYSPLLRATLVAFLAGGVWGAWVYLVWSFDALYLTERRLIEVSGIPHIREERRELQIERIQSVEVEQRGLLMRWCGCGDLVVDIAGAGPLRFVAARDVAVLREQIQARLAVHDRAREAGDEAEVRAAVRQALDPDESAPPLGAGAAEPAGPPAAKGWGGRARRPRRPHFGRRFAGVAWRRHRWFLVRSGLAPLALVAAAVATPFLLDALALGPLLPYAGSLALIEILVAGGWYAWRWADWRNDHYVVTPDRLIEIEQLPLGLRQQVSEAALNRVQDIRYRVPNPLAQLLDYGDVTVHTAGETTPFVFRGIARPRELARAIESQVAAFRRREELERHQALRAEFAQWLIAYGELSKAGEPLASDGARRAE